MIHLKKNMCLIRFTLIILSLISTSHIIIAQDLIIYKNGDEEKSKVMEVKLDEIRYKKWENLEGPIYSVPIYKVFMIKYLNGSKDVFSDSNVSQIKKIETLASIKKSNDWEKNTYSHEINCQLKRKFLSKGITSSVIAPIFFITGVSLLSTGYSEYNAYSQVGLPADASSVAKLVVGGVLTVVSIPVIISIPISFKRFNRFNENCKNPAKIINISPSYNIANYNKFHPNSTIVGFRIATNF